MPAKIILTLIEGNLTGQQFIFDSRTTCIIGRANDCNLKLPNDEDHASISRYHCLLDINPPQIRIRDLGSRYGTYVNDKLIGKRSENQTPEEGTKLALPEYDLQSGDEIKLGNTVFQTKILAEQKIPTTMQLELVEPLSQQPIKEINQQKKKFNFWDLLLSVIQRADRGEENLRGIKGYSLIEKIGEGGFGEVYLARNQKTQELVALKVLLPKVSANQNMVDLFLREAKNTKKLNHPNLVQLQDCCFSEGLFFFTLEYCCGGTVLDLMARRGGRLSIDEAIAIIRQLLDGLHYAHTQLGLVHRDIKPGNIFLQVTTQGKTVAKLGDYGLAKAFDSAGLSGQTLTGTKAGTPLFMPRQQVLNFKYVQPDVDVWATAATLYYMLTGHYPRDFGNQDPFLAILQSQQIPIRQRNASLPKALANLIDLALRDHPTLHFKNALAFKNALLSVIRNFNK